MAESKSTISKWSRRHAQSFEIVYIPCHRSHIDYLLLSYVLYHNGLTPPHIAAGKNLNLPLFGPLLRRGGRLFHAAQFPGRCPVQGGV